jgi:predicted Zn-dependent peptidase
MKYLTSEAVRQEGTTASGIRVVTHPIPNRPVAVTAVFNAGRRYDPSGLECLAHVGEHMAVAGSKELPSKDQIAGYIEQRGGSIAAWTGLNTLRFRLAVGKAADFGAAVYLLNQTLANSRYDETTLVNELQSVRQELAALRANPGRYVEDLLCAQLLSGTTLSDKVIDTTGAIDRVSIEDVRQYAQERLTGNNLAIVVAGGITPEEVIVKLDQGFELELGRSSITTPSPLHYWVPKNRIIARAYSSDQVQLAYGFPGYDAAHPERAALEVLRKALGGGRASALTRLLRYKAGLVYHVRTENWDEYGCSTWMVRTGTAPKNLETVVGLINGELKRAADGGLKNEEIARAKATLINSVPLRLDPIQDFLEFYEERELFNLPEMTRLPKQLEAIAATTLSDVTRAAQGLFQKGGSVLTLCGAVPESAYELPLY